MKGFPLELEKIELTVLDLISDMNIWKKSRIDRNLQSTTS